MLIMMSLNSPREHIEKVKEKIRSKNCMPHEIPGSVKLAIGITGPSTKLSEDDFLRLESVDEVVRVSKPYKLVSREMKPDDTIIKFNNASVGGESLTIIAGPCSVENRQQIFDIAGELKEMGIKFLRAGAYKPRSSPYSFQGLKEKGLEYLSEVKNEIGLMIVTEVKDATTLPLISQVADVIQVGARNMQNFSLLEEVGQLPNAILLKRGMSATIEDLLMSAEYILSQGNYNVILCERGIRTFETYTRNTLDLNAVPVIKKNSHLPIIVDPSHGIGIWDKVPAMAMAAIACGADGVMIEVHSNPEQALSDGFQSLTPKNFKMLLNKLEQLAPIVNKKVDIDVAVT
ncbi:MAG: 3-deoxy-7-phosphoheptulonate synthase [Ignavibacteria bacterium RBG_16_34_14]|nr:MAG: 3-deoxy-7-phosphoheptulonate synthase [Ignavibacteria bacterium RBG_16_34_14]